MNYYIGRIVKNKNFLDASAVIRGAYRVICGFPHVTTNRKIEKEITEMINRTDIDNSTVDAGDFGKEKKQENDSKVSMPQESAKRNDKITKISSKTEIPEEKSPNLDPSSFNYKKKSGKPLIEKAIPSTSFSRALNFGLLGASIIGNSVSGKLKSSLGISPGFQILNEKNAEKINMTFCKLRGAALKIGQVLSIQEDKLLPEPIKQIFAQSREMAFVMPQRQMEKMMVKELGQEWKSKFKFFDEKPFAAASIGQVHFGILHDETAVAIKIQYPNVKEAINSDMNNLSMIFNYTNLIPATSFMDRLIDFTRKELHEECDYILEAQKQEKYKNFVKSDRGLVVPKIIKELSTKKIMVSEYCEGDSLDDVAEHYSQNERDKIGEAIMNLTLKELFLYQFMQTDPNFANFFYDRKAEKLILVDFGATTQYSKKFCDLYIHIMKCATEKDTEGILKYSKEIGFLNGYENALMKETHVKSVMIIAEPFTSSSYDFSSQAITERIYENIPVMLKNRLRPPPTEIYSFHRKFSGAFLINIKLKSKISCKTTFENLLKNYKFDFS